MNAPKSPHAALLLLSFLWIQLSLCNGRCIEMERKALLHFKQGLKDPYGRLTSWVGYNCCTWKGVGCSKRTGHVVWVDLRNTAFAYDSDGNLLNSWYVGGEIDPSLLSLKYLNYLDLSVNDFGGIPIPSFLGSFERLRYLNLSFAFYNGTIPHQIGNLSNLQYLDLSGVDLSPFPNRNLRMESGRWLSHLSSLQYLNLERVDLSKASYWLSSLNMLPSLSEMHLSNYYLYTLPSLFHVNFTSLHVLDFSENYIKSAIPLWLFKMSSLEYLDLSYNNFKGPVSAAIGNLISLKVLQLSSNGFHGEGIPTVLKNLSMLSKLDLSFNNFSGHLPDWFGELKNLKTLDLSNSSFYGPVPLSQLSSLSELYIFSNKLNGTLPERLGQLQELVELDLSYNNLEGVLTKAHFAHLTSLKDLDLSSNSLFLNVESDWSPPPQLEFINLNLFKVGPAFPTWLRKLENIS